MAKKKKSKNRRGGKANKPNSPAAIARSETRAAEVLTIGWMLATLATFAALLLGLVALAARGIESLHDLMGFFAGLLLMMSLASGIVTLVLTVPVLQVRQAKPPRSITIFAVAVGIAPILVTVLLQLAA